MSKTVVIPSTQGNPWTCSVNNHKYSYEAGSTQEVPDEVAAIIDSADDFPKPAPEVQPPFPTGGGGGGMMIVTLTNDGDNYIVDKTFEEIKSAVPNVKMFSEEDGDVYNLSFSMDNIIVFTNQSFDINEDNVVSLNVLQVNVYPDNSVEYMQGAKEF